MSRGWPNNKMVEVGPRSRATLTIKTIHLKERHSCSVFEVHLLCELSFTLTLMTAPINKGLTPDSCAQGGLYNTIFIVKN